MKTLLTLALMTLGAVQWGGATTTINATNRFAYGANLGWIDWRGFAASGAVIGEYVCSDYLYSANVGWIHLGNGTPTNGIQYANLSPSDYGVNHDGFGNLRGYAYSANVGWVRFGSTGNPRVDLSTGILSGSVWSANCGWISLSNAFAFVQTDVIASGADTDSDGMADAWELTHFETTATNPDDDADGDGATNLEEYLAGTDPDDSASALLITSYTTDLGGRTNALTWQSVTNRNYYIEKTEDLSTSSWSDSGLGEIASDGISTSRSYGDTNAPARYYRVRAVRPLAP